MSNSIGSDALQGAIFSALSTALPDVPIYDEVPETADMPYIVIGKDSIDDNGTKLDDIYEISVEISIYSNYKGMKEVKEKSTKAIEALDCFYFEDSDSVFQILRIDDISHDKENDDMRSATITVVFLAS